jgi:DNA-binding response OmpR family regulator
MVATGTLLCIHRDPAQLNLLREKGFGLITATNGSDGLRLLMSQSVDAIVLEYHLGLLDGAVVADEIKQVKPQLPIVMVAEDLEFPDDALKSVDALVAKSDGPHFLWAAVHFVLNRPPDQRPDRVKARARRELRFSENRMRTRARLSEAPLLPEGNEEIPFSPELWESILNGTFQF